MISGLYSAATGMDAATRRHETAAENLANVQMPGYRRRIVTQTTFESMLQNQPSSGNNVSKLVGTETKPTSYDFSQGHFEDTGRPLDMALTGEGFFTVNGPGGPMYTRNGSFYVDANRTLTTVDNLPVMGPAGPIVLPPNVSTEAVEVTRDGRLFANGQEFGQFRLAQFADDSVLTPTGSSLFAAPPDTTPAVSVANVTQRSLEISNTSSIDELINLVEGTRHFEASQKALTTIAEAIQKRIGLR
jgi:flagellar basal body rod protein FlgG